MAVGEICYIEGCNSISNSRGVCKTHRIRFNKYNSFELPKETERFSSRVNKTELKEFICKQCNVVFIKKYSAFTKITPTYCSVICMKKHQESPGALKSCEFCNSLYSPILRQYSRARHCSSSCRDKDRWLSKKIGECDTCGQDVLRRCSKKNDKGIFCSKRCSGAFRTINCKPTGYRKLKIQFNIVNDIPIECERCKIQDIDILVIHHIDHSRKNNEINNLMILCGNCHLKEHRENKTVLSDYISLVKDAKNAFRKGIE